MNYIEHAMKQAQAGNCKGDTNFFQALEEVLVSIEPLMKQHPEYLDESMIERIIVPNRVIQFKIEWIDDNNHIQVNNGYRIQFNNALGPYKGGTRFHPTVTADVRG